MVTPIQLIPMIGDPSGQSRPVAVKYETAGEPCEGFDITASPTRSIGVKA